MRLLTMLSGCVLAMNLGGAELPPNVLRLIGADTKMISGIDAARLKRSALHCVRPEYAVDDGDAYSVEISRNVNAAPLKVAIGLTVPEDLIEPVQLDATTWVSGEESAVKGATRRWNETANLSANALEARRLSGNFDIWFLMRDPFEARTAEFGERAPKALQELSKSVEQVSGGIRLGSVDMFALDVVMRTSEDATTLAAFAKWLPGLMELSGGGAFDLVELIDGLNIRTDGRTVSISFSIAEERIREALKARHEWI